MTILLRLLRAAILIRLITLVLPSPVAAQAAPAKPDTATRRPVTPAGRDSVRRDSAQRVGAVQVTATFTPTRVLDAPQPVAVIGGAELRRAQGAAVGDALEQLPGIRSLSMTTGIGKPVIRGLTHNRIVTLDNGQRSETQQWGHDHSPNVETANAEQIEVIKGPASVLYGSDALGGVINIVAPALPDARSESPFLRGRATMAFNTNVMGPDATLRLDGARGGWGGRVAATGRLTGDMRAPRGVLRNTENETGHLELATGYTGETRKLSLRASERLERIEIFDDPVAAPGYTGYQRLTTRRGTLEGETALGERDRLQLQLGLEQNFRREYDAAGASDIALGLLVNTASGFLHYHHRPVGPFSGGTIGVFALDSRFEKRGTETLIPNSRSQNAAVYALEHIERGRWRGTVGARWDLRSLSVEDDAVLGLSAETQRHQAITGSVGSSYRLTEWASLVASIGRGFRAPAAPDLYANGFHEGTRAFERGNPDLRVETSLNTDLGLRIEHARVTGELSVFRNAIDDFIYLRPFGSGGAAFDSLEVVQGNAMLRGAEARVAVRTLPWLTLQAAGDIVRGTNTSVDVPLTFVPPPRVQFGARVEPARLGALVMRPWLSVQAERNWRQTQLDPRDLAPPGYTLWQLGGGGTLLVGARVLVVDVAVRNVFDTRYRSFMSRYKEFADGPGRAVVLRLTTDF
jgi:outer membrane receptor protein involved in Fe transport